MTREEAIKTLRELWRETNDNWYEEAYDMAIEALSERTGEWIFRTDIPIGGGRESAGYVCSNCRKDYFRVDGMNFCPNCGADMRGGGADGKAKTSV